jgi:hypothetical protein
MVSTTNESWEIKRARENVKREMENSIMKGTLLQDEK